MVINFDMQNKDGKMVRITEIREITSAIENAIGSSAKQTPRTKLDFFKRLIYNMPTEPRDSPTNALMDMKSLGIPDDLYYIYSMMSIYLKNEEYIKLKEDDAPSNCGENYINYVYDIPELFLPIFTAFILASQKKNYKEPVVLSFFHQMDSYLQESTSDSLAQDYGYDNAESLLKSYNQWMCEYLGRDYFIHLEELYREFAKSEDENENEERKRKLKSATALLTDIVYAPSHYCCTASVDDLDNLLQEYKRALSEKAREGNSDHSTLYQEWVPFPIESERNLFDQLNNNFNHALDELSASIRDYFMSNHNPDSKYETSVLDMDACIAFLNNKKKYLSDLQKQINECISKYYCYYIYQIIMKYSQRGTEATLQSNNGNIRYCIQKISNLFEKSLNEVDNELDNLIVDVKRASGKEPQKYNAEKTMRFRKLGIINSIKETKKRFSESAKENIAQTHPALLLKKEAYVVEIGFPLLASAEPWQNPRLAPYFPDHKIQ